MDAETLKTAFRQADGLIITAGAGMGVDSGLPDFRGPQGFWHAYPALGRARIAFEEIANPMAFHRDARQAWGFYGHRLSLYRQTLPHTGYAGLLGLSEALFHRSFVFTSNVDGQFQKAGFSENRVVECHGSIHVLQCLNLCGEGTWSASEIDPVVDRDSGRLISELPRCPHCNGVARPNILMFGDGGWIESRTRMQEENYGRWRREVRRPVVVEVGAGTWIPTVRRFGESQGCPLIRINPRDFETSTPWETGIAAGAVDGIAALCRLLS